MAAPDSKLHIALFPWLAFGHMIPFLELAKAVAKKGHKVTFISTPRNIDRLPKLPPDLAPLVSFITLPLPHVEGLPEGAEATADLPYDKVQYLKKAYDELQQPLTVLLQSSASEIDWLFYDFVPYWLPAVASSLGISHGIFSIFLATAMCLFVKPAAVAVDDRAKPEDFTVPPKWVTFPTKFGYRLFEILRIFDAAAPNVSDVSDVFRFEETFRGCEMVAVRSCFGFEPEWLNELQKIHRKPCLPVGVLPATEYGGEETEEWKEIKQWLDRQGRKRVVYVAFGSEATPSQAELTQIAAGLELSGLPFFWVLRKRLGSADEEVLELPEGFEERTQGRGLVWNGWAPQLRILSHELVGGFLTHSGWSSVIEAAVHEIPLILLTFLADQGLNARLFEDKKMAYPIPRNENDGYFSGENVAESLKLVVEKEEGRIYRDKIKEVKLLFGDPVRQENYIHKFLDHLRKNGRNQ